MEKAWPEECPGCKKNLLGPVKYCPFCGKEVEEPPLRRKGPVIKGLSISPPEADQVVVKAVALSEDGLNIEKAEWWIGDDPGHGKGNSMDTVDGPFKSSRVDITASIDISDFKPGNYQISVRSQDLRGEWGNPQSVSLIVPPREEAQRGGDEETVETEVNDTGDPSSPESTLIPPSPHGHLFRNVLIVCVLIAACLFVGYKIISSQKEKAQLSITTSPSGASLTIDGKNMGQTPKTGISVYSGTHQIVVEKEGYSRSERSISVGPKEKKNVKITLSKKSPLPPPKPSSKEKAEELVSKGKESEKIRNYSEALQLYKAAKEVYPDFPGIDELISSLQNKLSEEERKIRRVLEGDINRAFSNRGLRDVHILINRDFIGRLQGYVDREEDKVMALDIARSFKDLKEVRDNIQVKMSDGIGERKSRAEELVTKGKSSEQAGKFEEALNFFNSAMMLYPDLPGINEMIVSVKAKIREERHQKRAEEFANKGKLSEQEGRLEEALSLYMEARRIYPDFPGINKLIKDVQDKIAEKEGSKRSREGDGKKAIEDDLKEAIAAFNNFQYDVAIKMCQSILRKDPNNRTAQQYLQKAKEEQEKAIKDIFKEPGSVKKKK